MSQFQRSTRKPTPEIYRRRRIAALVVLAVATGLIWIGVSSISNLFGGSATNGDFSLPEGMAESGVVVESGQACPPGTVVAIGQVGDSAGNTLMSFAADETVYVWFTLTNTNDVNCTFNAGAKVQYFTVSSGDQQIWTSKQCDRTDLADGEITLASAETISSPPAPWEKVYSSESGCGEDQTPVTTDGASYHLNVEVNGELSTNRQQFVLN
jgi:hypothetical protein